MVYIQRRLNVMTLHRRWGDVVYVEDIYSFAVNTINIVIECNENISIFTEKE